MATSNLDSLRRKLALIIDIGDYVTENGLPNAINDAKDMSTALQSIGFVIHDNEPNLNLTYKEMRHVITDFVCSVEAIYLVLFSFAGDGTQ